VSNGPSFNIHVELSGVSAAVQQMVKLAQFALDTQVVKDSNKYIPFQEGILRDSAITASAIGEGKVIWNTPYARRLYYNPEYKFNKDRNPDAQGLWFEAAKSANKKDWEKIANQAIKGSR
jgi:hypothetical protein